MSFYILKVEEKTGERDGKSQLRKRVHILSTDRGLLYVGTEKLSADGHMESAETPDSFSGCDLNSSRLITKCLEPQDYRPHTESHLIVLNDKVKCCLWLHDLTK